MYRIDDASAAPTLPTPEAAGTEAYFTEGTPGVTPATAVRASWLNAVQENLRALVVGPGLAVSKTVYTRLLEAVKRLAGANVRAITATTTLTADDAGYLPVTVAANATLTLPLANAAGGTPIRITLARLDVTAFVVTLARAGSDTINGLTSGITLPVGATVILRSDGVSAWRLVGNTGLSLINTFTASGTATAPWWARRQRVKVWGGGGGGGGTWGVNSAGGGGAGGGFAEGIYDATPGTGYAVTVGAGGAAGTANGGSPTAGGTGGTSSLAALISATGGAGGGPGNGAVNGAGATPGNGTGGLVNRIGGDPNAGATFGGNTTLSASGGFGAGGGGSGGHHGQSTGAVNGIPGFAPGGGAAGGINQGDGAAGARGEVVVEWLA